MPRPSDSTYPRPIRERLKTTPHEFPLPSLPNESPVKSQLDRILGSRTFSGARRSQLFLRYILHHSVAHPTEPLKEYSIALDVFERDASYDPAVNNTVRVEAGRLRSRLRDYYAVEGQTDPLLFEVPKGSYRVLINPRDSALQAATIPTPPQLDAATLLQPAAPPRPRHLWAVPVAFVIGAFIGYRASH